MSKSKPRYTAEEAVELARRHFGVNASAARDLPSYDDQNFQILTDDGSGPSYCLKFAAENAECRGFCDAAATRAMCEMENEAMEIVRQAGCASASSISYI